MSSNDNIFRVTGPFWGECTGHRWIPLTRANDAELWRFLLSAPDFPSWRCQDWFKILTADIHSSSMNSMSGLHFTVVISMLYGVSFISDRVINETRLYQMHGAIMNTKGPGHIQDMKYTFYHHKSKRLGVNMLLEYYVLPCAMVPILIGFELILINNNFCAKEAMRAYTH